MAKLDWSLVERDVDWIVNAMRSSHYEAKGDNSNMFQLESDDGAYVNAVEEELKRYDLKVVSRRGAYIGVRG